MNKEKLKKIPHLISGFVIMLHALERFEYNHQTYLIFLVAGIVFFCVAIFHKFLSQRFPLIDVVFYTIEGLLAFVIAYEYYHAGKSGLPYAYAVAGLFQFFAVYKVWGKGKH